jgi:DUF4097 and DUF4098 domain-containing protein YvlB
MRNAKYRVWFGLVVAVLLPAVASAETPANLKQSYPVSAGGKLVVDADRGSIEVTTAEASQLEIEVLREIKNVSESRAQEILDAHEVTFSQDGNTVTVTARGAAGWQGMWNSWLGGFKVRYLVKAPRVFDLDLKTSGGSIQVKQLKGQLKARTSGGSLRLGDIEGPVDASTSGGAIQLADCRGNASVRTSGGSIEIGGGAGSIVARTSGGSIRVREFSGEAELRTSGGSLDIDRIKGRLEGSTSGGSIRAAFDGAPTGESKLATSGGGITVTLPENAALELDAATSGGRVSSDLPVTVVGEHRRNALKGAVHGGGPLLRLRTSGGSIHVRRA